MVVTDILILTVPRMFMLSIQIRSFMPLNVQAILSSLTTLYSAHVFFIAAIVPSLVSVAVNYLIIIISVVEEIVESVLSVEVSDVSQNWRVPRDPGLL